ncbi:MAG: hypothetical protein AAF542_25525 [Pseudomonadota bacterium]
MKRTLLTVFLTLISSSVLASPGFLVSAEIKHKNETIGSPALRIAANSTASVKVSGSYDLKINLKVNDENSVLISTDITVGEESHSPSMLVALDQDASITVGDMTLSLVVAKSTE